ncbi:MAG: SurA N-terminal domain-containing protein [Nitrospinae bacterium]|nr:SurA N-terminal domain-containing protein [Nitrospinota bacterium]
MLNVFREGAKTWASRLLIWFVAFTFIGSAFLVWGWRKSRNDDEVAQVGSEVITRQQLAEQTRLVEENLRKQFGGQLDAAALKQLNPRNIALNSLISRALQVKAAGEEGIVVTDDELKDAIAAQPGFQTNGVFDPKLYSDTIKRMGLTPAAFEQQVKADIITQRLMAMVERPVRVSEIEARNHYIYENQPITVDYVKTDTAEVMRDARFTEEEARKWFDGHKDDFRLPETRTFKSLLLDPKDIADKTTVTQDELTAYYGEHTAEFEVKEEAHARHILAVVAPNASQAAVDKAEAKMKKALARVRAGEDFSRVAREMSEDPAAASGGDLGSFRRGVMTPEFEQVVFALKPGQVSEPFRTQFGFHIAQLVSLTAGKIPTLEEARDKVEARARLEKAGRDAEAIMKSLAGQLKPDNFGAVADKHPEMRINTHIAHKGQPAMGFRDGKKAADMVFALNEKTVSELMAMPEGYAYLAVESVQQPFTPPFDSIRDVVEARYRAELADKMAEERAKKVEKAVGEGKTLADAARAFGLAVSRTAPFSRAQVASGQARGDGARMEAFELEDKQAKTLPVQGGFVTMVLAGRGAVDEAVMGASLPELAKNLLKRKRERVYAEYLVTLRKKAEAEETLTVNEIFTK